MFGYLTHPRLLIPLILGLALLVYLVVGFGNIQTVWHLVLGFPRLSLVEFFLLMVIYEVVRGLQWNVLLRALHLNVDLRRQIFSFAGGEVTKSLPIGNFFQNYLLAQTDGARFAHSASATTLIIWLEVGVSVSCVGVLGVSPWPWLRWVALGGGVLTAGIVWLLARSTALRALPYWMRQWHLLAALSTHAHLFLKGMRDLLKPRVLVVSGALSAFYLCDAAVGLWVLGHALGMTSMGIQEAVVVYMFSLAMGLIIPLPVDLGITELSGITVLVLLGASHSSAVIVLLANRVLSLGAALLIALLLWPFFRREFHMALQSRATSKTAHPQESHVQQITGV